MKILYRHEIFKETVQLNSWEKLQSPQEIVKETVTNIVFKCGTDEVSLWAKIKTLTEWIWKGEEYSINFLYDSRYNAHYLEIMRGVFSFQFEKSGKECWVIDITCMNKKAFSLFYEPDRKVNFNKLQ